MKSHARSEEEPRVRRGEGSRRRKKRERDIVWEPRVGWIRACVCVCRYTIHEARPQSLCSFEGYTYVYARVPARVAPRQTGGRAEGWRDGIIWRRMSSKGGDERVAKNREVKRRRVGNPETSGPRTREKKRTAFDGPSCVFTTCEIRSDGIVDFFFFFF